MSSSISVDLPHNLGAEEAKRRIANNVGKLKDHIPGGSADVKSGWEGDRMNLNLQAMGQEVSAKIDVEETFVRVEVLLPGMLGFFGKQIESLLRKQGGALLEDKSKKS
ncbi:MAG TPA: polyhydroxyalkanoic acid system family protein [Allosphingosinicella sp.]|uniref:polyhydroxyalkanoic acid system family protein n=1 Tax=Allosphingosinicella sp. TaxID=2823234 RepID=UPI002EDAAD8A